MRLRYVAVMALVAAGCSASTTGAGGAAPSPSVSTGAGPVDQAQMTDSMSITAGPVEAAVAYVASTDNLMAHSPIGRREIFRSMLTPTAAAAHAAAFEASAEQLAITLDVPVERLVWVEAPITATLVDVSRSSAEVDVWTVSILGSPESGSPQQVWRTVHVGLELIGGRWLVATATADSGPTPAVNELTLQAGWDEFAVVAGWDPIVTGAGL